MNFKIGYSLFKEKVRWLVHPQIYRENQKLFEERKQFYGRFLSANDLVFDVGANLGNRVQVFLSLKNKVVVVEPQDYCNRFLKRKYGNAITLLKLALGAKKDKMTMYINSTSSTVSSLSKDWIDSMKNGRFSTETWDQTAEVEVDTLDNLIGNYGRPHFIKIDVEGFETDVLKGLSVAVPVISFEYTTPEHTHKLYECLDLLQALDVSYTCNYSTGEENRFRLENWISVPQFKALVAKDVQAMQGFGDVYVKLPGCVIK
jgi:FkbM family methyltransferase